MMHERNKFIVHFVLNPTFVVHPISQLLFIKNNAKSARHVCVRTRTRNGEKKNRKSIVRIPLRNRNPPSAIQSPNVFRIDENARPVSPRPKSGVDYAVEFTVRHSTLRQCIMYRVAATHNGYPEITPPTLFGHTTTMSGGQLSIVHVTPGFSLIKTLQYSGNYYARFASHTHIAVYFADASVLDLTRDRILSRSPQRQRYYYTSTPDIYIQHV